MKTLMLITACLSFAACQPKTTGFIYDKKDQIISIDSNANVVFKHFKRNDLDCYDTISNGKIIARKFYIGNMLLYKYPIAKEDVSPVKIKIKGNKDFLTFNKTDTITILNSLPPMNQSLYTKGAGFKRLSSFKISITPTNPKVDTVWLFLQGSQANAEITDETVYKDSVAIVVKEIGQ